MSQNPQNQNPAGGLPIDVSEQERVRLEKMEQLRSEGKNPYRNGVKPSSLASELRAAHEARSKEELEAQKPAASVAGQIGRAHV